MSKVPRDASYWILPSCAARSNRRRVSGTDPRSHLQVFLSYKSFNFQTSLLWPITGVSPNSSPKTQLTERYIYYLENFVPEPVEWVADRLTGWGGSSQKQISKKVHLVFLIFWISAIDTEISVKTVFGDQLTGWGGSSQKQNSKKVHLVFRFFWI